MIPETIISPDSPKKRQLKLLTWMKIKSQIRDHLNKIYNSKQNLGSRFTKRTFMSLRSLEGDQAERGRLRISCCEGLDSKLSPRRRRPDQLLGLSSLAVHRHHRSDPPLTPPITIMKLQSDGRRFPELSAPF